MADYSEHADLGRLGELRKLAPTEFAGFVELDKIVGAPTARCRRSTAS